MNRALLAGINSYPGSPLRGCLNDISDMASFLTACCGFSRESIRMIADSRATKKAIIDRLGWLLTGIQPGDRVLFHYSGHGVQLPTRNRQGEVDGLDEAICPYDFDWTDEHTIRDKDFEQIFSVIPPGVEFLWISDSCHSGDLQREMFSPDHSKKTIVPPIDIDWRLQTAKSKQIQASGLQRTATRLNLALISGCKDNQTSADALINNRYNGALTYYLLEELKKQDGLSIPLTELITRVNEVLDEEGFSQDPQLAGSRAIEHRPFLKA